MEEGEEGLFIGPSGFKGHKKTHRTKQPGLIGAQETTNNQGTRMGLT